jgi:hypothetical protein
LREKIESYESSKLLQQKTGVFRSREIHASPLGSRHVSLLVERLIIREKQILFSVFPAGNAMHKSFPKQPPLFSFMNWT